MRHWGNLEQPPRAQLDDMVLKGHRGSPGEHQAHVLDLTPVGSDSGADVLRPAPTWLVSGSTDGKAPDADQFKSAFNHLPYFIRVLEPPEDKTQRFRLHHHFGMGALPVRRAMSHHMA